MSADRMVSWTHLRSPAKGLAAALVALLASCGGARPEQGLRVDLAFTPDVPSVGEIGIRLRLEDEKGASLHGAVVTVEGNMNHAGMTPEFAEVRETDPGTYEGSFRFTMGGDWFLLVTATTPDGSVREAMVDVPAVSGTREHVP